MSFIWPCDVMINPCNRPWERRPLSFTHCFEKPVWKKVTNRGKDYIDFFSSVCVFWRTRTNVFVLGNKGNDLCLSRSMESYTNLFVELCWKISLWKKDYKSTMTTLTCVQFMVLQKTKKVSSNDTGELYFRKRMSFSGSRGVLVSTV